MDDTDQDNNNRMDLAFNADFDSSLLNWDSAAPSGVNKDNEAKSGGSDTNSMSNHSPRTHGHGASWDSSNGAAGFSQLPAFTMEEERQKFGKTNSNASNSANTNTGNGGTAAAASQSSDGAASQSSQSWQMMQQKAQQQQQEQQQQQQQLMVAAAGAVHQNMVAAMANNGTNEHKTPAPADAQQQSNGNGTTQQASTKSDSSQSQQQQQQANQLSNALQMASDSMTAATTNNTHMHPLAISSAANCPPHIIAAHQMQAAAGMQNALFPVAALSTLGANAAAAFAAAGFALPTVTATTTENNQNTNTPQQAQQQQQLNANALLFSTQALQLQQQQQNTTAVNLQQQQQAPQTTDTSAANSPPPFYLFDAPAELRINFMQSQRMHGLPVTEDSNSYHYGVAVNGFHPQLNAQLNPAAAGSMQQHVAGGSVTASSSSGSHHHQANGSVQLIDARHSNRKSGRIKNEREQRRAQRITELIDQLREKMESGGWKVEMKSKFHTLSS